jgi:DHA2 family multidrug resistance protein
LKPEQTNEASALLNVARNLGGSFGIAGAQAVFAVRSLTHTAALDARLDPQSAPVQHLDRLAMHLPGAVPDGPAALSRPAIALLMQGLEKQAQVLAYIDVFRLLAVVALVGVPLALLMRSVPLGRSG